ncbi:2-hydroxychromene-2-carboxylate isomerase [Azospira restricta]|uniref:2-hydroxychromene-2-carboxylate isomerase n=1 Tax=Azospira restricta TaxID=404405 RepID=A0A974SQD3_9RHOO|nr:2-hydroxychromene-2-carboxylate isomerase [Azospira restricta]QRJ64517.1 2-hydroxychromene-2-carboxylate isomerase [Azospira restricta]
MSETKAPLEFYFDFSSPYGYLASERIDELAAKYGRKVKWRPVLLGAVFKATGAAPLTTVPLKGEYSKLDFARSARFMGIPYQPPSRFPLPTQVAARAYYWLHDRDCAMARAFAHAVYRALFVDDRDISDLDVVLDLAVDVGADRAALAEAVESPEIKERLKAEVAAAIDRGVFGSPYIVCDGEPFMGADRLPQLEARLAGQEF